MNTKLELKAGQKVRIPGYPRMWVLIEPVESMDGDRRWSAERVEKAGPIGEIDSIWESEIEEVLVETCKTCKFKSACGGFRDREGRCPEGMVGHPDRWKY